MENIVRLRSNETEDDEPRPDGGARLLHRSPAGTGAGRRGAASLASGITGVASAKDALQPEAVREAVARRSGIV